MPDPKAASEQPPLHVLVAGGGIAAAEAALALRALAGERVAMTLLTPDEELVYRPASVLEPFGSTGVRSVPIFELGAAVGAQLVRGSLAWVAPSAHCAFTDAGEQLRYDVLLVATGALPVPRFPNALTFRGSQDTRELRALVEAVQAAAVTKVAFVVPDASTWALPVYEVALMTAARASDAGVDDVELTIVTPERAPLELFGAEAGAEVATLLASAGISCECGVDPMVPDARTVLAGDRAIRCDRVVALPGLRGPALRGLPADDDGFLRTTPFGHVLGVKDVYAAGDATNFPIKQGGVACQQADAVAQVIARRAGAPVTPTGYRPVLRGKLLTGARPRWLKSDPGDRRGRGAGTTVADHVLWWPPGKVAGAYLAPYLNEPAPPEEAPVKARAVISRGRDRGEFSITAVGERDSVLART
jgi:sulfide:quinone oxidoreductase